MMAQTERLTKEQIERTLDVQMPTDMVYRLAQTVLDLNAALEQIANSDWFPEPLDAFFDIREIARAAVLPSKEASDVQLS